jgi:hypothetical protein
VTGPADHAPAPAQWWRLPPEPAWPVLCARWGVRSMGLMALLWCLSLVYDAGVGRSAWSEALWALAVLLGWFWVLRRWLNAPVAIAPQALCWSDQWHRLEPVQSHPRTHAQSQTKPQSASCWRTPSGQPVGVHVQVDLGFALLLRIEMPRQAPNGSPSTAAGQTQAQRQPTRLRHELIYRWVSEADLHGPWRWRLAMAERIPGHTAGLPDVAAHLMASSGAQATLEPVLNPSASKQNRPQRRRA